MISRCFLDNALIHEVRKNRQGYQVAMYDKVFTYGQRPQQIQFGQLTHSDAAAICNGVGKRFGGTIDLRTIVDLLSVSN